MPTLKKSKRGTLTKIRIIHAAIELADENGIENLSMRNLAQILGVEAMSLYNHITNKDDLLSEMVDTLISKINSPLINKDWRREMINRAKSMRKQLLIHPWLTQLIISRPNVGPEMLSFFNATLGCLVKAGFSLERADHAVNVMDSHIYGYTSQELNFPFKPKEYPIMARKFLPMLSKEKYPYMYDLTMLVIEKKYSGLHSFDFGMELLLDGLEKELEIYLQS
ncbi:MAG: TetR/AcrR family transcriptional regulator [Leptospira sp.]|nr:TetR/AcrR family transcriptional regulator [Leptospira sp.]